MEDSKLNLIKHKNKLTVLHNGVDENLFTNTPVAVNTVNNGDPNEDWGGQCESLDPDWESYNTYWIDNDYSGSGWQGVNTPPPLSNP